MAIQNSSETLEKEAQLQQLAASNTFTTDWPTLRSYFKSSLEDAHSLFLSQGPPRLYRPPKDLLIGSSEPLSKTDTPSSIPTDDGKPPSESLLLSPSNTSSDVNVMDEDLQPSTLGGLVIPPFPPLNRSSRQTPSPVPMVRSSSNGSSSVPNGMNKQQPITMDSGVMEEDMVIGGKKMTGWMEEARGRHEIERMSKLLDAIPPFTIQRLAELLLHPTSQYSTFGKFLRALEKCLLVTAPWSPPSYTYVPSSFSARPGMAAMGTVSGEKGTGEDSTVPEGSTTPLFSPISFLTHRSGDNMEEAAVSSGESSNMGANMEEGLMSPLVLSDEKSHAISSSARSPTPEPESPNTLKEQAHLNAESEESKAVDEDSEMISAYPSEIAHSETIQDDSPKDLSHTPYLGRVDELDTGPVSLSNVDEPTAKKRVRLRSLKRDVSTSPTRTKAGVSPPGESGNLVPHGMSDKPLPISSTTTTEVKTKKSERQFKPLRRMGSEKSLRDRFVSGGMQEPEESTVTDEKRITPNVKKDIDDDLKEENQVGQSYQV
nr:hypothetical protein L203_03092 [Cryptococcus depauperatus CBS 7841]